jgi:hypothetical protein
VAIIDVAVAQDGEDSLMSQWDIRIFEDLGDCRYRLHHEQIGELGVRIARLRSAIETRFDLLELSDERGGPAGDESIKAHFVLRPTAGPQP